jgi:hypothetical protein
MTDKLTEAVARAICCGGESCNPQITDCTAVRLYSEEAKAAIAAYHAALAEAGFAVRRREMIAAGWIDKEDVSPAPPPR